MAEFKQIHVKRYANPESLRGTETKFWKKFQSPAIIKEHSPISHVNFSPLKPHDFVVTSSGKIQIFSQTTLTVKKEVTRFKDAVYGARFRKDSKLLVCGGEQGVVQVFDVNSRAILRHLKGHTRATHVTCFLDNVAHIVSASDDKTVRHWDMPAEKEVSVLDGHEDYIRCGTVSPASDSLFVTGSYDHTVRLWDFRSGSNVMTLQHEAPVESVLVYPTGGICLSAGANYIKAWDILSGGRLLFSFSNHLKTITSLCFNGDGTRLLSGSLDRQVKVYNVEDFSIVGHLDYPAPILTMALSPDDSHIVAGLSGNLISIKQRVIGKDECAAKKLMKRAPNRGTHGYIIRGQDSKPSKQDLVVKHIKTPKLRVVDQHLKNFEYRAALDSVLKIGENHPPMVVSVLQELSRRHALQGALSFRTASALTPLMYFLLRNCCNPRYSNVLLDVANIVLDVYTPVIGKSSAADKLFTSLRIRLCEELRHQKMAFGILGALDTLFAASAIPTEPEAS